ncbi:hypothetical protein SeMB42_g03800 [Synchytrium endobioticum]|uniref:E3 ubiquitin-protein ligase PEP5 n=1 Tax=Synchytrium endobioticum TaxID=286115 RepID=A0A507CXY3_9FUNG|nr:hypothetical protein SeLEV6574_g04753 [Synchytrium endobioticum]TPX46218.1 hypothetical protein SeMB42_g03800 [Synchytrium endobioticum]
MTLQWRQFNFVDRYAVSDPLEPTQPIQWLQNLDIVSWTSGRGHLCFGDASGNVHMVDHSMALAYAFQAYPKRVTHLKMLKHKNVLVTIGDDEGSIPTLKVWNMDKIDKSTKSPFLSRSSKLQYGNKVFPVTAFAALENMTQIAVGMENGVVILVRGDISRDRFTKQKIIHEGSECITGLGFREDGKSTVLFIATLAKVLTCLTSNKDIKQILDEHGCDVGCAILTTTEENQEMVIGRREAVYLYGPDGRGPCFIIDDDKVSMTWFRGYLAVVSVGTRSTGASSAAVAALGETATGTVLTLYDLRNKYIAYTGTFGHSGAGLEERGVPILCVLSEWNELMVITKDKKLFRLEDKDLSTKLDILFKKNMYTLAINIVTSQTHLSVPMSQTEGDQNSVVAATNGNSTNDSSEYDYGTIVEIYKRYGDHLYAKGEYDAAMQQYLMTAGQLEPSYVIRKFLDAQRIHNLTAYLSRLHELGLAGPDHTTLLLNCYTKLRDARKLYEFVRGPEGNGGANFDIETAIRVCRQAGYFDHALWLAEKHGQHDLYMAIQVEDLKDYSLTVEYLASLSPTEAVRAFKRYGTMLIKEMPAEVTDLLVKLCTSAAAANASPERFIHLFVGRAESCIEFLEKVLDSTTNSVSPTVVSPALARHASRDSAASGQDAKNKRPVTIASDLPGGLARSSSPSAFIASAPASAVMTTSVVTPGTDTNGALNSESLRVISNTLLELYLDSSEESVNRNREIRAMKLLQNPASNYDVDHALVLCEMHAFAPGILFLYEKMGMNSGILQHYIDNSDVSGIIATCEKYGDKDPSLWTRALGHFAEQSSASTNAVVALTQVLEQIDKKNLLQPLGVVQILARNSSVTLGMVKEYLIMRIENEKRLIDEDQKIIRAYKDETDRMRAQIEEYKTSPIIFQVTRCSSCSAPLELPTVHFLCKHSYHQRCLGDADMECPRCAPDHRVVKELVATQMANHGKHDVFLRQLERADDKFALIADYFSKSPFAIPSKAPA